VTFDEAVGFLSGRAGDGRRDRAALRALLKRLGNPEESFFCFHVAGTNGKGSTVAYLESVLREAGQYTGAYLSPHVFDIRERWLFDGQPISQESFIAGVERLYRAWADGLTEFELKTALAFERFESEAADIAVIEAGIGGRDDATNVLPPPIGALITGIGRDHEAILGDTLPEIAAHKAGIIKPGTGRALTTAQGEPLAVIRQAAERAGVAFQAVTVADLPADLTPGLRGAHQRLNAALAYVATSIPEISEEARWRGIERACLPGRFQVIERDGKTLVLDVAHNNESAGALVAALCAEFPGRQITLVVGVSRGHDPVELLTALAPLTRCVVATEPPFRPRPVAELMVAAHSLGLPCESVPGAAQAIEHAWEQAGAAEIVVVTGSFYTVGATPETLRG
jgi:dihydrofolate synthase / folylpolyglutamate synthase